MIHRLAVGLSSLVILAAAAGCGGRGDYNILSSFRPPSGVSASTSLRAGSLKIRRIGVLAFRNESGTPNAGKQLANIFYEGLSPSPRYEVQPPPPTGEDEDVQFEFRFQGKRKGGVRNQEKDNEWLKKKIDDFVSSVQPYVTNLNLLYPGEYIEGKTETGKKAPKGTVARSSDATAEEPDLDAYLTGVVTSYQNRSGGALIGDKGSHVTYTAYLISAKDGAILWQATFDEEQIFLSDNLLLLPRYAKHGFIWQTNDMLARSGLERVLDTFPGLRDKIEETKKGK